MSIGIIMLLGATNSNQKVNSEASEQNPELSQKNDDKRIVFERKLEELENERMRADQLKEQEAILKVKALAIAAKAEEEKRLAEEEAEQERLAEEKVEAERLAAEASKKEEEKVTSSTTVATSSGKEPSPTVQTTSQPANTPVKTVAKAPAKQQSAPVVNQTSGFNFNGHHFPLDSFSGGGRVPQETNRVYQWTDKPDHFLIERMSPAGRAVTSVGVGTKIVINGSTYTVTNMERNIPNNDAAVDYLYKHNASITFQTCETTRGANGKSHVRFWYAR